MEIAVHWPACDHVRPGTGRWTTCRFRAANASRHGDETRTDLPLHRTIAVGTHLRRGDLYLPDGIRYNQHEANRLSTLGNIVILCGHYKGIDYRVREHLITLEISIGDYVLTGGEAGRGDYRRQRGTRDSGRDRRRSFGTDGQFQDNLLAPPVYTRPADFRGWKVPDVLLSGNPKEIAKWQEEQAFERTERLRPDLIDPQSV
ncbi:MAG: hypothetical protein ACLR8Y_03290 [Alistipes indistinctus]